MIKKYRYLVLRRAVQFSILILFIGANYFGWKILTGNLSSAKLLDTVHLSDPFAALQIFSAGFILSSDVIIGGLTILALYAIIGGRAFCAWACPVDWFTGIARQAGKKLGINTRTGFSIPKNLRYWLLGLAFALSFILGFAAFEAISPIGILHRNIIFGIGAGVFVLLGLFLFEMGVVKYGWCGHICPLGAFYSIVGRYGVFRVSHDVEKCTDCMDCFKVCPEPQVLSIVTKKSGLIKSGNCTNCGRCEEICPDDALKLGHRFGKNK